MCGIVGYIGSDEASSIIINGLKKLEYRGYDSAGIAVLGMGLVLEHSKATGKITELEKKISHNALSGKSGIGHTRWATHGEPNEENAHPHFSKNGRFALVHNGIIENYSAIKTELDKQGHSFHSETDTEVLVRLIEEIHLNDGVKNFQEAVQLALKQVDGAYGIAIISADLPNQIIVAKKGSPLLLGIGENGMFVGSDASPIIEHTNKVVYLEDGEMAIVSAQSYEVVTIDNTLRTKEVFELAMDIAEIEKNGFEHFMLKEIYQQPKSIEDSLRGRLLPNQNKIQLGGIVDYLPKIAQARRLIITSCGTSWHAALVAEYLIEDIARIPVEVEYASEFRYRNPIINEDDVVIAISQSGETADTLAAIKMAKSKGALTIGICNVVGSSIARETDCGMYTHAGPEIGVASTKAFTTQITVLTLFAIELARLKNSLTSEQFSNYLNAVTELPSLVQKTLDSSQEVLKEVAYLFTYASNFLYMGRGLNFPIALEGALKLKEISYIHAEGYPSAEMKHGPIALIDQHMPIVVLATTSHINDKTVSNIEEVRARKGRIITIASESNHEIDALSEYVIRIPDCIDILCPILTVIPLQLLAYFIAVNRGCEVDQPRNLAKSVTVE
jgi:glucosamine--fructose-6-phosphate aminotransferase (isomerizing)